MANGRFLQKHYFQHAIKGKACRRNACKGGDFLKKKTLAIVLAVASVVVSAAFMVIVQAPGGSIQQPFTKYKFRVEIDGIVEASFMQLEGLNVTVDVTEYREGSDSSAPTLIPGLVHYGPLVLTNGLTSNNELLTWMENIADGDSDKRSMSIIILNQKGIEVARYNLWNAFPSSWRLGELDSQGLGPVVEELTIQYEGFQREGD
jgi:phage tail-like protein